MSARATTSSPRRWGRRPAPGAVWAAPAAAARGLGAPGTRRSRAGARVPRRRPGPGGARFERRTGRGPGGAVAAGAEGQAGGSGTAGGPKDWVTRLTDAFPAWVVLASLGALVRPQAFSWFDGPPLVFGIASTMLGMGLTLTLAEIRGAATRLGDVTRGVALQYSVMPLLGFLASRALGLPTALAVGTVLVACCPGGTASNIVSYLARADVPLSVAMTTVSTSGAVLATPFLTKLLAGTLVPVNALGMLWSTSQIVLLPVLIGAVANTRFPRTTARISAWTPLYAVLMVALICASVISRQAAVIFAAGPRLLAALLLLHGGGFALGYLVTQLTGGSEEVARMTSIEVGMQNSTLGAVLAGLHFADPAVAAPCALSSCIHSVIGSVLAGVWRTRDASAAGGGTPGGGGGGPAGGDLGTLADAPGQVKAQADVREWIRSWRDRTAVEPQPDGSVLYSFDEEDLAQRLASEGAGGEAGGGQGSRLPPSAGSDDRAGDDAWNSW